MCNIFAKYFAYILNACLHVYVLYTHILGTHLFSSGMNRKALFETLVGQAIISILAVIPISK